MVPVTVPALYAKNQTLRSTGFCIAHPRRRSEQNMQQQLHSFRTNAQAGLTGRCYTNMKCMILSMPWDTASRRQSCRHRRANSWPRWTMHPALTCTPTGSCRYPAATETRFAAYALIADVAPDDQCRQAQAMRFLTTQEHPDTLTPLAHGRLPDKQTIHRAELMIIVLATETLPAFQLYTDSSVAKSAFEKATMASSTQSFIDNPHYDLMCRIFVAKKQGHKVHKIKAHRELQTLTDLLDIYHGLGNQKADRQAAHALNTSMPEILSELEAYHVSVHQDPNPPESSFQLHPCVAECESPSTSSNQGIYALRRSPKWSCKFFGSMDCRWTLVSAETPTTKPGAQRLRLWASSRMGMSAMVAHVQMAHNIRGPPKQSGRYFLDRGGTGHHETLACIPPGETPQQWRGHLRHLHHQLCTGARASGNHGWAERNGLRPGQTGPWSYSRKTDSCGTLRPSQIHVHVRW